MRRMCWSTSCGMPSAGRFMERHKQPQHSSPFAYDDAIA